MNELLDRVSFSVQLLLVIVLGVLVFRLLVDIVLLETVVVPTQGGATVQVDHERNLRQWYYLSSIFFSVFGLLALAFTAAQVILARRALVRSEKQDESTLYLQIDAEWKSPKIEESLEALDRILKSKSIDKSKTPHQELCDSIFYYHGFDYPRFRKLMHVFEFFESIGTLVRRGNLDVTMVDSILGGTIVRTHEYFAPFIVKATEHEDSRKVGENYTYLAKAIRERRGWSDTQVLTRRVVERHLGKSEAEGPLCELSTHIQDLLKRLQGAH